MSEQARIDWEQVRWAVGFLAAFEVHDFEAGVWSQSKVEDGALTLPFWTPSPVVERFLAGLNERGLIVNFDWPRWWHGRGLARDPARIGHAGARTCLKLLTLHVRADRFTEGHLAAMFESGQIVAILRRLKVLLDAQAGRNAEVVDGEPVIK
jgi:hypothetical protein